MIFREEGKWKGRGGRGKEGERAYGCGLGLNEEHGLVEPFLAGLVVCSPHCR